MDPVDSLLGQLTCFYVILRRMDRYAGLLLILGSGIPARDSGECKILHVQGLTSTRLPIRLLSNWAKSPFVYCVTCTCTWRKQYVVKQIHQIIYAKSFKKRTMLLRGMELRLSLWKLAESITQHMEPGFERRWL